MSIQKVLYVSGREDKKSTSQQFHSKYLKSNLIFFFKLFDMNA